VPSSANVAASFPPTWCEAGPSQRPSSVATILIGCMLCRSGGNGGTNVPSWLNAGWLRVPTSDPDAAQGHASASGTTNAPGFGAAFGMPAAKPASQGGPFAGKGHTLGDCLPRNTTPSASPSHRTCCHSVCTSLQYHAKHYQQPTLHRRTNEGCMRAARSCALASHTWSSSASWVLVHVTSWLGTSSVSCPQGATTAAVPAGSARRPPAKLRRPKPRRGKTPRGCPRLAARRRPRRRRGWRGRVPAGVVRSRAAAECAWTVRHRAGSMLCGARQA